MARAIPCSPPPAPRPLIHWIVLSGRNPLPGASYRGSESEVRGGRGDAVRETGAQGGRGAGTELAGGRRRPRDRAGQGGAGRGGAGRGGGGGAGRGGAGRGGERGRCRGWGGPGRRVWARGACAAGPWRRGCGGRPAACPKGRQGAGTAASGGARKSAGCAPVRALPFCFRPPSPPTAFPPATSPPP